MSELPLEITVQEAAALLEDQENLRLIDCREEDEYAICQIAGSRLVPLSSFGENYATALGAPTDQLTLVYCHHGARSLRATQFLRAKGYSGAQSIAGGIEAWSRQIDPEVPRY